MRARHSDLLDGSASIGSAAAAAFVVLAAVFPRLPNPFPTLLVVVLLALLVDPKSEVAGEFSLPGVSLRPLAGEGFEAPSRLGVVALALSLLLPAKADISLALVVDNISSTGVAALGLAVDSAAEAAGLAPSDVAGVLALAAALTVGFGTAAALPKPLEPLALTPKERPLLTPGTELPAAVDFLPARQSISRCNLTKPYLAPENWQSVRTK